MVRQIRTEVELDSLLRRAGNSLSVLYFSSPRCGPCRYMTPYFEDDFVAKFNVTGLPAFYYFRNGEEVDCFAGGNKDYLLQSLTRNKLRG
ncbi:thioredoxin-like isoform X4 [Rhinatrema bivittatum]|uniref:thioredoxin-like isoform X4 n=1 Tax=Rhinatrema bivittatum TaxID=194408 RepID=UPI0011279E25|nr:thioredoxin-like isoform X4 [Rhinatrema bivittatum]